MTKDTKMSAVDEESLFSDEELFANGKNTTYKLNNFVYFFIMFLNLNFKCFPYQFLTRNTPGVPIC